MTPSHGLFLTCRGEKITVLIKYCTLYSDLGMFIFLCKNFTYIDLWSLMHRCKFSPTPIPCCMSTATLHDAGHTPPSCSPWTHPLDQTSLSPHTCDTNFASKRLHRHTGTILGLIKYNFQRGTIYILHRMWKHQKQINVCTRFERYNIFYNFFMLLYHCCTTPAPVSKLSSLIYIIMVSFNLFKFSFINIFVFILLPVLFDNFCYYLVFFHFVILFSSVLKVVYRVKKVLFLGLPPALLSSILFWKPRQKFAT